MSYDRQLTLSRSAPSHRNYSVALRRRNIYTDTLVSVSVFYIILNTLLWFDPASSGQPTLHLTLSFDVHDPVSELSEQDPL